MVGRRNRRNRRIWRRFAIPALVILAAIVLLPPIMALTITDPAARSCPVPARWAHRAGSYGSDQDTPSAARQALAAGFGGIEVDYYWLDREKRSAIQHLPPPPGTAWTSLQLKDFLSLPGAEKRCWWIDFKRETLDAGTRAALAAIDAEVRRSGLQGRLFVETTNRDIYRHIRRTYPDLLPLYWIQPSWSLSLPAKMAEIFAVLVFDRAPAISIAQRNLRFPLTLWTWGRRLHVFAPASEKEIAQARANGADVVLTILPPPGQS